MYLQGRDEYSMDNHLSPTVLGTFCRPGGLQKKKGCVGNDQSLSLLTRSTQSGREIEDVVTKLLSNRREGDQALISGPN